MARKIALCVGQNVYQRSDISPLRGCVNDALAIGEMLRTAGFEVRQVHDERATQKGILDRLSTEIAKLREGDYFVFWNSSHGYQLVDREGDELYDFRDEAICTYDTDVSDPLTDDKFGRLLYRADPGAHIFFASDSCHSGTLTKAWLGEAIDNSQRPRLWIPPDDVRFRSGTSLIDLDAFVDDTLVEEENSVIDTIPNQNLTPEQEVKLKPEQEEIRRFGVLGRNVQEEDMGHIFLSGCLPEQTSMDARFPQGNPAGKHFGAMTYNFLKAVLTAWRNGKAITYGEAHEAVLKGLEKGGFEQKPQLEGPDRLKDMPVFGHKP